VVQVVRAELVALAVSEGLVVRAVETKSVIAAHQPEVPPIAAEDLAAAAEITRARAALEVVAAWEAAAIAEAVTAEAAAAEEEDSVVAVAVAAEEVAVVAAAAEEVAVVAAAADAGDKRTIDGENNYEINNQKYYFVEASRDRRSDCDGSFFRVGIDRGAG
jgi:hypothetical protein